ncbi:MAG: hypothetical protein GTO02_15725 [Candidatus Dadabacteria bacterium]|nr:hypothetical protein [Candidatus Dadabacteria bacterium]NIQ15784.1 hypothetical protein [Candidatus Dadabacteria bacterium]
MLNRARFYFNNYFFKPGDPINPGISRFVFYGLIFLIYFNKDFASWGNVPDVIWSPILLFQYFPIPVLNAKILGIIGLIWKCSLFFSSIGILTRINTIISFLFGIYLLGIINSFGKASHAECLMLVVLLVLAFSRCGDGFSVDKLIRDKFYRNKNIKIIQGEYIWPIKLIMVLLTLAFFSAGMSKLKNSGFDWITSDYLSNLLIVKSLNIGRVDPLIEWLPFWIAEKKLLCKFLAATTVLLELSAPLALFNKYLRLIIIPGLFLMQVSFWILLGIPFPQMLAIFIFFIPFGELNKRIIIGR